MTKTLNKNKRTNRGFTLVELLVVISIIGLLSSFAIVSLNSARVKARDALRKGDMAQMRTALALLYDDNGGYPICNPDSNWEPSDAEFGSNIDDHSDCYNDLVDDLVNSSKPLMMSLAMDPRNRTNETIAENSATGSDIQIYRYISDFDGQQFAIIYFLEEDQSTPQVMRGF